jgi:hypothetical protein
MTFKTQNLSVLAYAAGYTLWHYNGASNVRGDTLAPGFFADAGDLIRAGDTMFVSLHEGAVGQMLVFSGAGRKLIGHEFTASFQRQHVPA